MRKVVALILVVVAALVAAPAHSSTVGKWNSNVVPVYIAGNLNSNWNIDNVIAAWNQGPVTLVRVYEPCSNCIVARVVYPGDVDWAAQAYVYNNNRVIDNCLIELDGSPKYHRDRSYNFAHEVGHCLGLEHNTLRRSVMSISSRVLQENRPLPNRKDIANLWAGYSL